jgi:hypothetical protein
LKCFTHFRFNKLQAQQNSFFWLNNVFVKVKVLFVVVFYSGSTSLLFQG